MPSAMKAENGLSPSMNHITCLPSLRIICLLNQRKTQMRARGGFLRFMSRTACLSNLLGKKPHNPLSVALPMDAGFLSLLLPAKAYYISYQEADYFQAV